jgi:polyisoprenoid-binding protein YceI
LMEDHFNENYMESSKFPKADFKGYLSDISKIDFTKNGEYPVAADGTLTIHGQSNKVVVNGILAVQADGVTLKGQFTIQIKDFGIRGSYIGDKIASQVNIRVNCQYK